MPKGKQHPTWPEVSKQSKTKSTVSTLTSFKITIVTNFKITIVSTATPGRQVQKKNSCGCEVPLVCCWADHGGSAKANRTYIEDNICDEKKDILTVFNKHQKPN